MDENEEEERYIYNKSKCTEEVSYADKGSCRGSELHAEEKIVQ
jgi:hypothetical protein